MGDNTRLLYDLRQFVEDNKIQGLLLLIDFENAFDAEWPPFWEIAARSVSNLFSLYFVYL